jgi:hypothetical protein
MVNPFSAYFLEIIKVIIGIIKDFFEDFKVIKCYGMNFFGCSSADITVIKSDIWNFVSVRKSLEILLVYFLLVKRRIAGFKG